MTSVLTIAIDDPLLPDVRALLAEHLDDMRRASPPGSVHALDPAALAASGMTFWTARDDAALLGCAALGDLGDGDGELKSMRTAASARRRGVAAALLGVVVATARERGMARLLLETGTQDLFATARRLYARQGFVATRPFAAYRDDPNSVYLALTL